MADDDSTAQATDPVAARSMASRSSTHWSVVFTAGRDSSPDARGALGELYTAYLPPLLIYLRSKGNSNDDALDLLHGFFEHLLETKGLSTVEKKGKFRSWLLASLNHFVIDVWKDKNAEKRGGGRTHLPVGPEFEIGEVDPLDGRLTPEQAYDRKWAITLLKRALSKLAVEYADKPKLFDALKIFLSGKNEETDYRQSGAQLGMKSNSVAVAVKRMRERYRELLRAEIRDTVEPEMVE